MKSLKFIMPVMALSMLMTSCMGDDEGETTYDFTYTFECNDSFSENGEWSDVYNTGIKSIFVQPNMAISHEAKVETYDGIEYKSWKGFTPTRGHDYADHSDGDWTNYQWSSAGTPNSAYSGGGAGGSMDYMLACWDVQEPIGVVPDEPSCVMAFGGKCSVVSVFVNNSNWGYWAMKNGSAFSKAFNDSDWCKVVFYGTNAQKQITGKVEFYLAKDGKIVNEWTGVDLRPLGEVSYMFMQMESSDTGQWGMNNPAYFCLDNLRVQITD